MTRIIRITALLLVGSALAACGGSGAQPTAPAMSTVSSAAPAAPPAARNAAGPAAGAAPAPSLPNSPAGELAPPAGSDVTVDRKIILNADISLKVDNARKALNDIQDLATFNHGYVSDANLTGSDTDGWNAKVVLRIPSGAFGDVMSKLRAMGEVRQERQWTQDVSEQYIDLQARQKTMQEYLTRLQELALKAGNFDDWLKLTRQINDTQVQLESITGKLRLLSNQVDFSTFTLSVVQPPGAAVKQDDKPAAGVLARMVKAFQDSAKALTSFGEGLLVFLAGFLPVGVVLVLLGSGAWYGYRRWRGRSAPPPTP